MSKKYLEIVEIDPESGGNALEYKDTCDQGTDYVLVAPSCWIEVETLSIWIRNVGDGIQIEICPNGDEGDRTIKELYVPFSAGDKR